MVWGNDGRAVLYCFRTKKQQARGNKHPCEFLWLCDWRSVLAACKYDSQPLSWDLALQLLQLKKVLRRSPGLTFAG